MLSILLAASIATAPVPVMTTDWWSNLYDTPLQGVGSGEMSIVVAEITVNPRGYFASCIGHSYLGNPQMGPYVCSRLKKRAVFDPARDPQGHRVTGVFRKLIVVANVNKETRFKTPKFGIYIPAPAAAASDNPFRIQFYLDASGQVSDCSLVEAVGINSEKHKQLVDPNVVKSACAAIPTQLKPVPPRDKKGNPIPTTQNALVIIDAPVNPHNQ